MNSYILSFLPDPSNQDAANPCPIIKGYLSKSDPFDFDVFVFNSNDDDEKKFYIRKLFSQFQKFKYVQNYEGEQIDSLNEIESYPLSRIKKVLYSIQQLNHFAYSRAHSEKVIFLLLQYGTMLIQVASFEVNDLFIQKSKRVDDAGEYFHSHLDLYEEVFIFIDFIQKNRIEIVRCLQDYGQKFIIEEILKLPVNDLLDEKTKFDSDELKKIIIDHIKNLIQKTTFSEASNLFINYLSQLEFCLTLHSFLKEEDYLYKFTKEYTSFDRLIDPLQEVYRYDYDLFTNSPTYFRLFYLFFQYKGIQKVKLNNVFSSFRFMIKDLYNHLFFGSKRPCNDPLNYELSFSTKYRNNPIDPIPSLYQYAKTSHLFSISPIQMLNQPPAYETNSSQDYSYISYYFYPIAETAFNLLYNQLYSWCSHVSETAIDGNTIDYPDVLLKYIRHWTAHEYILYQQFGIKVREATLMAVQQNASSPTTKDEIISSSDDDDVFDFLVEYLKYEQETQVNEQQKQVNEQQKQGNEPQTPKNEPQKTENESSTENVYSPENSSDENSSEVIKDQKEKSEDQKEKSEGQKGKSEGQKGKSEDQKGKSEDQKGKSEGQKGKSEGQKGNNPNTKPNNENEDQKDYTGLTKTYRVIYHYVSFLTGIVESDMYKLEYKKGAHSFYYLKKNEKDQNDVHPFQNKENGQNDVQKNEKNKNYVHPFLNFGQLYKLAQILGPEGIRFITKTIMEDLILSMKSLIDKFNLIVRIGERQNDSNIDYSLKEVMKLKLYSHSKDIAEIFARIGNLSYLRELLKFVFQTYIRNYHPKLFMDIRIAIAKRNAMKSMGLPQDKTDQFYYKKFNKLIKYFDMKDDCEITKTLYKFFTDENAINNMLINNNKKEEVDKNANQNGNNNNKKEEVDKNTNQNGNNNNNKKEEVERKVNQNDNHVLIFKKVEEKYASLTWKIFDSIYYINSNNEEISEDNNRISDLAVARGIDEFFSLLFCYRKLKNENKNKNENENENNKEEEDKSILDIHKELIDIVSNHYKMNPKSDNDNPSGDNNNTNEDEDRYKNNIKVFEFAKIYLQNSSYFHQKFSLKNNTFWGRARKRGIPVDSLLIDITDWLDDLNSDNIK